MFSVKHAPGEGSVDPKYPYQPSRAVDHHEVSKFLSKQLSLDRELLKSLRCRNCFLQRSCGKLQTPCHWFWHVPNLQRKLVEGLHAILSDCVQKIKKFMMSCTGRSIYLKRRFPLQPLDASGNAESFQLIQLFCDARIVLLNPGNSKLICIFICEFCEMVASVKCGDFLHANSTAAICFGKLLVKLGSSAPS